MGHCLHFDARVASTNAATDADAARVRTRSACQAFFAFWKDADPALHLEAIQGEYAKLQ